MCSNTYYKSISNYKIVIVKNNNILKYLIVSGPRKYFKIQSASTYLGVVKVRKWSTENEVRK